MQMDLPLDCWTIIINILDLDDVCYLISTCKMLNDNMNWRSYFLHHIPNNLHCEFPDIDVDFMKEEGKYIINKSSPIIKQWIGNRDKIKEILDTMISQRSSNIEIELYYNSLVDFSYVLTIKKDTFTCNKYYVLTRLYSFEFNISVLDQTIKRLFAEDYIKIFQIRTENGTYTYKQDDK